MPFLTRATFDYRRRLMSEMMRAHGLDALAFTGADFFQWATNFHVDVQTWERPIVVVDFFRVCVARVCDGLLFEGKPASGLSRFHSGVRMWTVALTGGQLGTEREMDGASVFRHIG